MYKLIFLRQAEKQYNKLSAQMTRRINQALDRLVQDPFQHPQAIPLKENWKGFWRWRVGDWRIIYEVDEEEQIIYIEAVVHRSFDYH